MDVSSLVEKRVEEPPVFYCPVESQLLSQEEEGRLILPEEWYAARRVEEKDGDAPVPS